MPAFIDKFISRITDPITEKKNVKLLKDKGIVITNFRVCNAPKDNIFVDGHINAEEGKIYFASDRTIEINSILVDRYLNLYRITASVLGKNQLFDGDIVTTICDYVPFVPSNPVRNVVKQNATISQAFSKNSFDNIGTLVLNVEQKASIEQSISISQMVETVEDEVKYRYSPIKNASPFLGLISEILKGIKTIDELQNKVVQSVLKETSSFLKDVIEMLIKKIKSKSDESGYYKE